MPWQSRQREFVCCTFAYFFLAADVRCNHVTNLRERMYMAQRENSRIWSGIFPVLQKTKKSCINFETQIF